jgi:hypothetical protein
MDSEGNIFYFSKHPNPEEFIAERDLVVIPEDKLTELTNADTKTRKQWYAENKS